ncbi:PAS domain S-box protein [bacterium]|nr:PAS domain S-box protein [bacterium]
MSLDAPGSDLSVLFQVGSLVMLIIDPADGRIVDANEEALRFYGYSRERMLELTIGAINGKPEERLWEDMRKAGSEGGRFICRHRLADGSLRDVEVVSAPLHGEGRPLLYSVILDITASKRAERELEESDNLYRTLFENAGDAILIHDLGGRFLECNHLAHERLGYTREELLGLSPLDLDTARNAALFPERQKELVAKGRLLVETEHRRKDGSIMAVELSSVIIRFHEQPAVLTIARDITRHRESINNLEQQADFSQRLIDTIPSPVFYKDIHGCYQGCNRAFEEFVGIKRDQLIGRTVFQTFFDEHARHHHSFDQMLLKNPGTQTYESVVRAADGQEHQVVFHKATYYDSEGRVAGMVGVFTDMTERIRFEEVLRRSEEKYRQLVENISETLFTLDAQGLIEYVSPAIKLILGFEPESLLGRMYEDVIWPDDRQRAEAFVQVLLSGKEDITEIRLLTREGRSHWVRAACRPFYDENKVPQGIQGVLTDIDERKRAEEALRESEVFIRSTVDSLSAHIAIVEASGRIMYVNRAWKEFATANGGDRGEHVGMNYLEICDRVHGGSEREARLAAGGIRDVLAGKKDKFELEYSCHSPERERWFNLRVTRFTGGIPARAVVAHEDITERVLSQQALRRSEETYRDLVENISDVIYSMDTDRKISYISPAIERITGYTPEELVGGGIDRFVFPEDMPQLEQRIELLLRDDAEPAEYRIRTRAGGTRWIRAVSTRVVQNGQVVGLRGRLTDITERKRAEEAIQTLVESSVGTIGQEFFDRIVGTLCRWLGADVGVIGELVGPSRLHPLSMMVDGGYVQVDDYDLAGTPCEKVYAGGFKYYREKITELFPRNEELRRLGAEGYIGIPLTAKDGRPIGIINAVFRRVTNLPRRAQDVLSIIAARASAELEHKKLKELLSVESRLNSSFAELSSRLIQNSSLESISATVLDYVRGLTGSPAGFAGFIDARSGSLNIPAATNDIVKLEPGLSKSIEIKEFTGPWGPCLRDCNPVIANSAESFAGYGTVPEDHIDIGRFIAVPALIDGEPVGVIAAANAKEDYTQEHRVILERVATLYALAIKRRRAEEQVRKLSVAVEQSPTSIVITDSTGAIEYVNPKFSQLTGYSFDEALGQNPRILKTSGTPAETHRVLWETIMAGREWKGEFLNRKKNGELFWEMASIAPVKNENGEITHFIGVKKDITDLKQAEEKLQKAHDELEERVQERTRELIQANVELKKEVNERQRAEVALKLERSKLEMMLSQKSLLAEIASRLNSAESFSEVTGFLLDDIRQTMHLDSACLFRFGENQSAVSLLSAGAGPTGNETVVCPGTLALNEDNTPGLLVTVLKNEVYFIHNVTEAVGKEREYFEKRGIQALLACPLALAGQVKGLLLFVHHKLHFWVPEEINLFTTIADMVVGAWERNLQVHELIEAERKRTEATRLAEQSSRLASIGVMAGGITHEINQPLNAIKLTADSVVLWIQRNPVEIPGKMVEKFKKVSEHVSRIDEIIKHMRQFWVAPTQSPPGVFDLHDTVCSALDLIENQIGSHGIHLETVYCREPLKVQGARINLEQIVINLVVNAMQALDETSRNDKFILVKTVRVGDKVRIEVRDNGPGFPAEMADRLFDPFYSTKKPGQGTGLGLAIVKRFVDEMRGRVEAAPVPEGGAVFSVMLPLLTERNLRTDANSSR